MKKLLIFAVLALSYALPAWGQKTDSAFIKALNNTFNFEPTDSSVKEVLPYWPDIVSISFTFEHFQNLKETAPLAEALKNVPSNILLTEPNNILLPLGIDYSLICFSRCSRDSNHIECITIRTKPGQTMVDAIRDLKQRFPLKIRHISPVWFDDVDPASWPSSSALKSTIDDILILCSPDSIRGVEDCDYRSKSK